MWRHTMFNIYINCSDSWTHCIPDSIKNTCWRVTVATDTNKYVYGQKYVVTPLISYMTDSYIGVAIRDSTLLVSDFPPEFAFGTLV